MVDKFEIGLDIDDDNTAPSDLGGGVEIDETEFERLIALKMSGECYVHFDGSEWRVSVEENMGVIYVTATSGLRPGECDLRTIGFGYDMESKKIVPNLYGDLSVGRRLYMSDDERVVTIVRFLRQYHIL